MTTGPGRIEASLADALDRKVAEFSLAELLDDPLTRLVMESDRVDRGSLEALLASIKCRRFPPSPGRGAS